MPRDKSTENKTHIAKSETIDLHFLALTIRHGEIWVKEVQHLSSHDICVGLHGLPFVIWERINITESKS